MRTGTLKNGLDTTYHDNGQIEAEANYKDGECVSGDCSD